MENELIAKIFTPELKKKADELTLKYETKRASLLMLLRLVQSHYGHIGSEEQRAVAHYLGLPEIDVVEVMTFYTLFHKKPRAKTEFHVCRTLTCALMGSPEIVKYIEERLGIKPGEMTPDGAFSLEEVECLGACECAPMLQLNDGDYIGRLTREKIDQLIEDAKRDKLEGLKKGEALPI